MAATPSAAVAPEERSKPTPSGRLLLRMPAELHAELARAAEREGTSLNGFITRSLAARVGWGDEQAVEEAAQAADPRTRLVLAALVANAVVIGLAAAAAIAILVLAWQS
jgi:RNA polymerase sigma-B factor